MDFRMRNDTKQGRFVTMGMGEREETKEGDVSANGLIERDAGGFRADFRNGRLTL